MRRITILFTAVAFALALMATSAVAMQPPGEPAQSNFGCPDPVSGHPGAAGLVDATPRVGGLTAETPASETRPTAWSASDRADPIVDGEC